MSKRSHDDLDERHTCNKDSSASEQGSNPDTTKRRPGIDSDETHPKPTFRLNQVFDTGDNSGILDLARASTSTLRIKVFHRCFGKCLGLYYPSRMKDADSRCIECCTCHVLMKPKRFIRHAHGSKEENVCHWGFASNNWRHYISLKKNQDTNDLDDEELMRQLELLRSAPDRESDDDDYPKLLSPPVKIDQTNLIRKIEEKARRKLNRFTPRPPPSTEVILPQSYSGTDHIPVPNPTFLTRKTSAIPTNNPIGIVRPTMSDPFACYRASTGVTMSPLVENLARRPPIAVGAQRDPSGLPYMRAPGSTTQRVGSSNPLEQRTLGTAGPYTPHYPLSGLLGNPLLFSHHFDQSSASTSSNVNSGEFLTPIIRLDRIASDERLFKQDMFVSSSLVSYLSSRNVTGDLARGIIEQTLDAVHKSRMMF